MTVFIIQNSYVGCLGHFSYLGDRGINSIDNQIKALKPCRFIMLNCKKLRSFVMNKGLKIKQP